MHQSQIHMADKITHITPDRIALGCSIMYIIYTADVLNTEIIYQEYKNNI